MAEFAPRADGQEMDQSRSPATEGSVDPLFTLLLCAFGSAAGHLVVWRAAASIGIRRVGSAVKNTGGPSAIQFVERIDERGLSAHDGAS